MHSPMRLTQRGCDPLEGGSPVHMTCPTVMPTPFPPFPLPLLLAHSPRPPVHTWSSPVWCCADEVPAAFARFYRPTEDFSSPDEVKIPESLTPESLSWNLGSTPIQRFDQHTTWMKAVTSSPASGWSDLANEAATTFWDMMNAPTVALAAILYGGPPRVSKKDSVEYLVKVQALPTYPASFANFLHRLRGMSKSPVEVVPLLDVQSHLAGVVR